MCNYPLSLRRKRIGFAVCLVTVSTITLPAWSQSDSVSRLDRRSISRRIDLEVYEGVGVGKLRLGDPTETIERVLGEADAGSEHYRRYVQLGLYIQLYEGKVYTLTFDERFPGKLLTSGLGIGDTLADLEHAYGPVLERREVGDHNAWQLDRVLLVRQGGPQFQGGDGSKIEYYDLGMYFYLDEHQRILRFGLSKTTWYALRPAKEREGSNAVRVGVPSASREERDARWKASKIRDWGVREGVGFAGVEFDDPATHIEGLLGPPDTGSENAWRYRELGITVALNNGRASAFFFHEGRPTGLFFMGSFPGKLVASGIGVGDRLEDVEAFYGVVLDRQKVRSLAKSTPSRVLGVCQGCTAYSTGESSRLWYNDLGLYFDFDDRERIVGFGLTRVLPRVQPTRPASKPED